MNTFHKRRGMDAAGSIGLDMRVKEKKTY